MADGSGQAIPEVLDARDIFIDVNALDYSGYPDCRAEFIAAFQTMANLATKQGIDYSQTISCYDPIEGKAACGHCDACLLRAKGFAAHGMTEV
nr:7-cyano-7-deazaguanine synthase [Rubripirellula obstinata]